ncbi:unnamed protein product [Clonostachys solani]|uniref:Uncharacterized protein n=1 Tax=Clonostachys solani TaxID=160281 RepID=A0A9N9W3Z8_9HYPO|nr:unnamed protein product [Clonostachys solani]
MVLAVIPVPRSDFTVEEEILQTLFNQDDSSPARAVERIVERGMELAESAENPQRRISNHAYYIACGILRFAMSTPHDQQSKLIEFLLLLSKETAPDTQNAGVLKCLEIDAVLWTDIPYVIIVWRDYVHGYVPEQITEHINIGATLASERFYAFLAQLSELGFYKLNETVSWCYDAVAGTVDFPTGDLGEDEIRLLCLWLIYAPNKLRQDALLRREDRPAPFRPEFWDLWKKILVEYQDKYEDNDTQDLIFRAQASMASVENQ